MNTATLGAQVTEATEIRYTIDGERKVAVFKVVFKSGWGDNQRLEPLKVLAWGKQADVAQQLAVSQEVILNGYLSMNVVERDGFKEKIAQMTALGIFTTATATEEMLEDEPQAA
ncbi:MAG: single-stranded DNA-binding protein [Coleofasciculus sp. A1-SPW-01]|uniref:single-stranded DNA-binding protein n=1 Tax=Coleofasciculus TaxID=669368 RepID=UPI000693AC80|nr:single-stranded DNA-binding protein [Coleofasciculus chthonoplastes]